MGKFLIAAVCLAFLSKGFSQCTANFSVSTTRYKVSFTSLGSTLDGTITSFFWDFGDGTTSAAANPTHTYQYAGTYSAMHIVQNNSGTCNDTIFKLIFISSPFIQISLCPPASTDSLDPVTFGDTYQWQVSTDSINYTEVDIGNYYSITPSHRLMLTNIPSSFTGYRYRCLVDGGLATTYRVSFANEWKGTTANWSQASNWSCGTLPDANTDIVIANGSVIVDVDVTVRSLLVQPSAALTVQPGVTLNVLH